MFRLLHKQAYGSSFCLSKKPLKYRVSSQKVDEITIIANLQFVSEARGVFKGLKTLRKRMYIYKPSTSNVKIVKMTLDFEF